MTEKANGASTVVLVACCGAKLDRQVPAAELYVSTLFKKSRTYAESRGRWFIVSALHGLLDPQVVTAPYDVTLKSMPSSERREWGRKVREQVEAAGLSDADFVALAGMHYVKPLIAAGLNIEQPMKGLGIGKQLQWLNERNGERCNGSEQTQSARRPAR